MSEELTTSGITVGYLDINTMYEDSGGGSGGGGGEPVEPLIVNIIIEAEDEETGGMTYTLDKTFNEIKSAYEEGKIVLLLEQTTTSDGSEMETYRIVTAIETETGVDYVYYVVRTDADYYYETTDPDEYPSFVQNIEG